MTGTGEEPAGAAACPICAGRRVRPVLRKDGWVVLRCVGCTNGFLAGGAAGAADRGDVDWHRRQPEAHGRVRRAWRAVGNALKDVIFGRAFEDRKLRRVLRWQDRGRLLDVGCARGEFLSVAQRHFEVHGVEVSATALERAHAAFGPRVFAGDLRDARFAAEMFDVVTLFSTVEHLADPVAVLRECRRVLREGGILVVKTPNFSSLNRQLLRGGWSGYKFPEHRFFFSPRGLRYLFASAGLEPLPSSWLERFPLSDSMYAYARKGRDGEGEA
ncbi:MAG: class I SAM-dependent methyltransferase [candidate division NC10 bacterium]|nr:class I SAM-dependent methyltransferase [candidate division NC10 bacterium]